MKKRLGLKEFLLARSSLGAIKQLYYSPTCTVAGFDAGYTGRGLKTVLPCKAMAKVGFRLPYALTPDSLFVKLKEHLKRHGFSDINVIKLSGYEPCKTSIKDPFVKLVAQLLKEVYRKDPVIWPTLAGTSPMYTIKNWMGIPVVSCGGSGYPDSMVHASNENIRISDYIQSIKFVVNLILSFK